jgi:tetratricopeptide (TPR) repeat protein
VIAAQGVIKTDSLDSVLRTIMNPKDKVDIILKYLDKPENQYMEDTIAMNLSNRAYQISQQTNYASGKVNAMLKLSSYYFRSSDYKKSMEFAQRAKEMSEDLGYDKELANSLSQIGTIYSELEDFDHSSQYLFKSLKLFEKINDKEGISLSLGNIGIDFSSQQDYKKALEYHNNSLILAKEIKAQSAMKTQYNNIAVVYEYLQKYDTAILFFRKALEINIRLGNKLGQGINIMNIGYDQMNKGNFDNARLSFQQALDLFTEVNNRMHMAECYLNFGFCNQAANRTDESIKYFKKALYEGQKNGYYRIIAPAAKMLNQIYKEEKDTLNAYKFLVLEKLAGDSLYASKKLILISKFELQYIYDKKEFERQQGQQAKNIIILIIIFGLIAGLVVLGLVLSRYRLKSRLVVLEKEKLGLEMEKVELEKEKIKSELDIKDRELTVNLMSLIKKNEILADISNKLAHLENIANGNATKETIAKISQELRNSTDDKMFNEFSQRFQEVHAGFYDKLLQTYPDLSQNELKLCAFLRLNMSTKDIAELTGQQLASIDTARYRLRKKLALSGPETNLVTFLSQI